MLLGGCETLQFYTQAVHGQMRILYARQSSDALIASPSTDGTLRQRLELAQDIVAFAETELSIDRQGRYSSYVDVGTDAVVWNVFASRPDEVRGYQWCYPIVGCAPYRGYFRQADAQALAQRLEHRGYETHVSPVPAYSTLGWFKDPLLSTFCTGQKLIW